MKSLALILSIYFAGLSSIATAQNSVEKKIVITGARFTYPLVEKWIKEYKEANPAVKVVIEPRTTTDPSKYDLLIEAYESEKVTEDREYLYLGKYAIIPVANASSKFAKFYGDKGLTRDLLEQAFFHNLFDSKESDLKAEFTVYTRLQKAGVPTTFAQYFGFEQEKIKGKGIAGSDEHLIKAVLGDSAGVTYNNPGLLYDLQKRTVLPGLAIIPVDANDNGHVSKDEKFYDNLDALLTRLEEGSEIKNIPTEYFHLSIAKHGYNPEALKFLRWVIQNSQEDLHAFGFLKPDQKRFNAEKEKFEQFASK